MNNEFSKEIYNENPSIHDYLLIKHLGNGKEGSICLYERLSDKELVAIKTVDCSYDQQLVEYYAKFNAKLIDLRNPYIVTHYAYWYEKYPNDSITLMSLNEASNYCTRIRYVMEYVNGPNMKIFTRRYTYSLYNCYQWVLQIALALQYLHQHNIIHRDIKPENIIVYYPDIQSKQLRTEWNQDTIKDSKIKIVDFGMGKQLLDHITMTNIGTPLYQSPENAQLIGYDSSTDIWSLGIVILELLLRLQIKKMNKNYSDHDFLLSLDKHRRHLINQETNRNERLELYNSLIKSDCDEKLCNIMYECLDFYPVNRITAAEIVQLMQNNDGKTFIHVDPKTLLNSLWQENEPTNKYIYSESVVSHSLIDSIFYEMPGSKQFWLKFGSIIQENISWRTFTGTYCSIYGRLNKICERGLQKLLAFVDNSGRIFVSIYTFSECCEMYGFPFNPIFLEKVERYGTKLDTNNESKNMVIYDKDMDSEKYSELYNMYFNMIIKHDKYIRDIINNKDLSLEEECIPLKIYTEMGNPLLSTNIEMEYTDNLSQEKIDLPDDESDSIESDMDHTFILTDELKNDDGILVTELTELVTKKEPILPQKIICFGSPASGKTTLLHMLMYNTAKLFIESKNDKPNVNDYYIPLLVSISLLSQQYEEDIPLELQFIRANSSFRYSEEIESFLYYSLKNKKVLLLCDGLDEAVSRKAKSKIEYLLFSYLRVYNQHAIIITSRINSRLIKAGFIAARILPLSIDMQIEIARRRGINDENSAFLEVLRHGTYNEITRIPMLLSLFISIYTTTRELPSSRAQVYKQTIDSMLTAHFKRLRKTEVEKQISADILSEMRSNLFTFMLSISKIMHERRIIYFTSSDIASWGHGLGVMWNQIEQLVNDGKFSLIVPISFFNYKRYRFTHLSFQEYLLSQIWSKEISEEIMERKMNDFLVKKMSIPNFLKLLSKEALPKVSLESVDRIREYLTDIWYKEAFSFLSQSLSLQEFKLFCYALLNTKDVNDITFDSVVLKLVQDSKFHDSLLDIVGHLFSKSQKGTILKGSLHHNPHIRRLSLLLINMLNSNDSILDLATKYASNMGTSIGDGDAIGELYYFLGERANKSVLMTQAIQILREKVPYDNESRLLFHKKVLAILKALNWLDLNSPKENVNTLDKLINALVTYLNSTNYLKMHNVSALVLEEAAILCIKYCPPSLRAQVYKMILDLFFTTSSITILDFMNLDKFRQQKQYQMISLLLEPERGYLTDKYQFVELMQEFDSLYNLCGYAVGYLINAFGMGEIIENKFLEADLERGRVFWQHTLDALSVLLSFGYLPKKRKQVIHRLLHMLRSFWMIRDKALYCLVQISKHNEKDVMDFATEKLLEGRTSRDCSVTKYLSSLIYLVSCVACPTEDVMILDTILSFIKHEKFDVRREALKACVNLLLHPTLFHSDKSSIKDLQTRFTKFIVDTVLNAEAEYLSVELIKKLPIAVSWLQRSSSIHSEIYKQLTSKIVNLIKYHQDAEIRIMCAEIIRELMPTHEQIMDMIDSILGSKCHINIRKYVAESIICLAAHLENSEDIIPKIITLLKPCKHAELHSTVDDKGNIILLSDNDIIFNALMGFLSGDLTVYHPFQSSSPTTSSHTFGKIGETVKKVLLEKHIEQLNKKKSKCFECEFILLAHFWEANIRL